MTEWTAPRTYVVGEVITEVIANQQWRDNEKHIDEVIGGTNDRLITPKAWGDRPIGTAPVALGGTATTIYTCPASTLAIVTMIRATCAATTTVTLSSKGKTLANAETLGNNDTLEIPCFIVLTAGETVQGLSPGTVKGSVVVWEVPSAVSGYTFKYAAGAALTASGWRTLLTATVGKNMVGRFVMLQAGATPFTYAALGVSGLAVRYDGTATAANGCARWAGEIGVPGAGTLQCYTDQDVANWIACGWEEA